MRTIKNVVFDLGGVVLEWNPGLMRERYIHNSRLAEFLFTDQGVHSCWQEFDRGTFTEEDMIRFISGNSGETLDECRKLMQFIKDSLANIPETVELIKELSGQGYNLYCLSNLSVAFYEFLKNREFFDYLNGRIISACEGVIKPDPAIYNILVDRFGLIPGETLFIDDLDKNILAAQELGFHTVHFTDRGAGYRAIRSKLSSRTQ